MIIDEESTVSRFLRAFVGWSQLQRDIVGVALVGSHARHTANQNSDVDLIILTLAVEKYFSSDDWLSQFGEVSDSRFEQWGRVQTLRAFYKHGLEIEYNFTNPDWASLPMDSGTQRVVKDGLKILCDPQGVLGALQG